MTVVLDASAVLAALLEEPGGDQLRSYPVAVISSVNLGEIAQRLQQENDDEVVRAVLNTLPASVIAVDRDLGIAAGMLWRDTRIVGLSLGDRCCLALARHIGCPAVTADRAWARVARAIGVEIIVIR